MLIIHNRSKLKGERVLSLTTDGYNIEGVYEYEDYYQINIHSTNNTFTKGDEILILQRNKVKGKGMDTYNYYTLYNMLEPQRRKQLTIAQIRWKDMFIHNIELILQMNN
jgi:hypothetical protein